MSLFVPRMLSLQFMNKMVVAQQISDIVIRRSGSSKHFLLFCITRPSAKADVWDDYSCRFGYNYPGSDTCYNSHSL